MRKALTGLFIITLILMTACSDQGNQSDTNITSVNDGSMGDLHVETENMDTLPHFLDNHHENMQIFYRAVVLHQELLVHILCFCCCGDSVGYEIYYIFFIIV